jgi:hypothetical protein
MLILNLPVVLGDKLSELCKDRIIFCKDLLIEFDLLFFGLFDDDVRV